MAVEKRAVQKKAAKAEVVSYIPESVAKFAVPMAGLTLKKNNPRKHDVPKIVELIKLHGFRVPIIIDKDGVIQSGNGRYKAAKELGMKTIPAIRQDFLSKESAEAFSIIENKSHEWSSWDDEMLQKILSSESMSESIDQTGFTKNEVSKIKLRATEKLFTGIDLGWLFASACRSPLGLLHYGVVRGGYLCVTDIVTYARVKIDAPNDTVFDLNRYRTTGDLSKSTIPGADAAGVLLDFPSAPEVKDPRAIKIDGDAFMSDFVSTDTTLPLLRGICIDGQNKYMFATDGHIGVGKEHPADKQSISIPISVWRTVCSAGADYSVTDTHLILKGDGWEMIAKVSTDAVPNFKAATPAQKDPELFDVRGTLAAIRTLVPLTNEKTRMARFVPGAIQTAGSGLPAHYDIAVDCPIRGAFNAILLEKILSAVEKVSRGKPCKYWSGPENISARCFFAGEYTFLIMPLRDLSDTENAVVYERLNAGKVARGRTMTLRVSTPIGDVNVEVGIGLGVKEELIRAKVTAGKFSGEIA